MVKAARFGAYASRREWVSIMASNAPNWWDLTNYTPAGTDTLTFPNGKQDYEKGDVFGISAGTPIKMPVAGTVAWESGQQAVVKTSAGVLNFLHLNPSVPVGTQLQPGQVLGSVSNAKGYVTDPATGHWYYEPTGNVLEVGLYDTVQRAINRDNSTPSDMTGIANASQLSQTFKSFDNASGGQPAPTPGINNVPVIGGIWQLLQNSPGGWLMNQASQPVSNAANSINPNDPLGIGSDLHAAGQTLFSNVIKFGMAIGFAIAGFILLLLVFRKPIENTAKVAAVA